MSHDSHVSVSTTLYVSISCMSSRHLTSSSICVFTEHKLKMSGLVEPNVNLTLTWT